MEEEVGIMKEEDVLTVLYCMSREHHAFMMRLEPIFFSEKYRLFFQFVQDYYKEYGCVPWKPVFETEMNEEHRKDMISILDKLTKNYDARIKKMQPDYIRDKLALFAKRCFIRKYLAEGYVDFQNGKYDEIIEKLSCINDSIIDANYGSLYLEEDAVEERYGRELTSYIPSKFLQIDEAMQGWHKKALHILAGPANSGKTMYLVNAVARQLIDGVTRISGGKGEWFNEKPVNILYITLEIDEEQVNRRIDSCLTNTPTRDLDTESGKKALRELVKYCKNDLNKRVVVKEMPGYKTTPADIEACMRNLDVVSKGELKPDIVVVDYIGLLSPTVTNKNMGLYEKGLALSVELRSIAQRYDIPVIAAAQTNRDSFSQEIGMDKISDSIGIAQTADVLITINRNEELDREDCVILYLAKSRFSRNGLKFLYKVNYECMRVNDYINDIPESVQEMLEGKKKKKKEKEEDSIKPLPDGDRRRPPKDNSFESAYGDYSGNKGGF